MAGLSEHEDHGSDADSRDLEGRIDRPILHPGLPAGANFGNLIHDSLELIPFHDVATEQSLKVVEPLCRRYGLEIEPTTVQALLLDVVNTPLTTGDKHNSFSLAQIDALSVIKEMAFYFRLKHLDTARINEVLADEPTVINLSGKEMRGYLTGFVDLVCEHHDRYYVIDYKSNYLGESVADYQGDKLVQAMASHNYGLQYWIYTLVLHRYLQNVLEGYDYSTHFGGVMYLFVRGMVPNKPGSGVYFDYPDRTKLEKLDDFLGESDD
jgi:exodeoxyribonuclease V beta subunit